MRIIGTAGHVDHGKSTLVIALTGVDPDRLKEEKAREMTIDLGFASLTLPNGESMGIIDVPGHRDFIGNMLSGIGGIDAVLLIIAADEGVSAQTREHLAILDLLDIQKGFVVLTKIDLVSEPEWIDLVELEAQEVLANTSLKDAKILRVSAITGEGIPELLQALQELLQDLPPQGRPQPPAFASWPVSLASPVLAPSSPAHFWTAALPSAMKLSVCPMENPGAYAVCKTTNTSSKKNRSRSPHRHKHQRTGQRRHQAWRCHHQTRNIHPNHTPGRAFPAYS